jgi:hypothetical protein
MNEIAAQFHNESFSELDSTQLQILNVLKLNEESLGTNELDLLRQLEERLPRIYGNSRGSGLDEENMEKPQQAQKRPAPDQRENVEEESRREVKSEQAIPLLSQDDVEDVLGDLGNGAIGRAQVTAVESGTSQPQFGEEENEDMGPSDGDALLPPAFSLLAPLKVPITVTAAELFDYCKRRKEQKMKRTSQPSETNVNMEQVS